MSNLASLAARVDLIPDASPAEHAAARRLVLRDAPDLYTALFGGAA